LRGLRQAGATWVTAGGYLPALITSFRSGDSNRCSNPKDANWAAPFLSAGGPKQHRDQGILGYQFMIANTQSGPYSWRESVQATRTVTVPATARAVTVTMTHPAA
jgi:hypothetical protein